jgi:uncharacterized protein (DUF2235 family)
MAKNIVICCDGTGQRLDVHCTNVVRLFRALYRADPHLQIAFYDPGVGTMPATGALTSVSRGLTLLASNWVGYGLLDNVSRAYGFVVDHYKQGDPIYLFGFSRGAFTVRVLAGLLHRIGVLRADAKNLIPYALEIYRPHYTRISDAQKRKDACSVKDEFRDAFCLPGRVTIKFLGLWDTVKAFGFFSPKSLPHIRHNLDVVTVRHALALDEYRRSFVPSSWGGLDDFLEQPAPREQDVKEVWFAGSHSDVGGGYPEEESGLSWLSLKWMLGEASKCKLLLDKERTRSLESELGSRPRMDLEEQFWRLHRSRTLKWVVFDQIPRPVIENAPAGGSPTQRENLERDELPVPLGWPKRQLRFWPTTGRRHVESSKRGGKVLIHWSVRELTGSGKYPVPVDDRIVTYIEDRDIG